MPVNPVKLSELGALEHLAEGGQAVVYRAPEARLPGIGVPLVLKKYQESEVAGREVALRHGLARLIDMRERISAVRVDLYAVWPLAVVVKDDAPDEACGFLMRELPGNCFIDINLLSSTKRKPWEVGQLLQSDEDLASRGIPILDQRQKLTFLARLAGFIAILHRAGIVLGDFSARNVIVRPDQDPARGFHPMLVDVDSCRVVGEGSPLPQAHTPEWQPPESLLALEQLQQAYAVDPQSQGLAMLVAKCNVQNHASDVYKVALFALRLFHEGENQTGVRESDTARARLEKLLTPTRAEVLWRALGDRPEERPTMNELSAAIAGRVV